MEEWTREALTIPELRITGRINTDPNGYHLYWPLSGAKFQYTGQNLMVRLTSDYHAFPVYMAVLADGKPVIRFPLLRGSFWYPVLLTMDGKPHTIEILRETQPIEGNGECDCLMTHFQGDGCFSELKPAPLRIEFVGDSITCGEGIVGAPGNQEWNTLYLSPSGAYPQMISSALGADIQVVSLGGWGVYSDWQNNQDHTIPSIYEHTCAFRQTGDVSYDFSFDPDIVIVNLGTNDHSALQLLPESERYPRMTKLEMETVAFIATIRKRNPNAFILWTYGMAGQMLSGVFRYAVIRAKREGIDRTGYLRLTDCSPEEQGSRNHPGAENHRRACDLILGYLRKYGLTKENG
ncbi:MAG: hypothetical protein IJ088_06380 [Clostridia bacterium]|nr:hypothetical protein [Clostridia bacterium]